MIKSKTLFFAFLYFSYTVVAQDPWPDSSRHQGLKLVSEDGHFSIFKSDNANVDSLTLMYLKEAKTYFDQVFNVDFPVAVLFVSNEEWNQYAYYPPPGMPQAWAGNIFLGSGKSIVARQAEQQLVNLPQESLDQLQSYFGDPLDMDLFYRNNVAIHELGHLYQFIEVSKGQRRWLQEVFATYAARSFLVKFQPELAAATLAYAEIGTEAHEPHIKHKSLKAFEELYVGGLGPQNYEWFQFQLFKKVVVLHEKFGVEGLLKLRDFLVATDLTVEKPLDDAQLRANADKHLDKAMTDVLFVWDY